MASLFDIVTRKSVDDPWLLLIPTKHGHEVPVFIGFDGWNGCPYPDARVAGLRYWKERHGAELMTMGEMCSNCALALALEQLAHFSKKKVPYR